MRISDWSSDVCSSDLALSPENSLRSVLSNLDPFVATLDIAEIDNLSGKELRELSKSGSDLDVLLDRLRSAVSSGARLLRKRNLQPLMHYTTGQSDSTELESFIHVLPPAD